MKKSIVFIILSLVIFTFMGIISIDAILIDKGVQFPRVRKNAKINIPIFSKFESIKLINHEFEEYNEIRFKIRLPFLSKKVFQFYEVFFEKNNYEPRKPFADFRKPGQWQLDFSHSSNGNTYSLRLNGFWLNSNSRDIVWLSLLYEWQTYPNKPIKCLKQINQKGVLFFARLKDSQDSDKINIYHYFINKCKNKNDIFYNFVFPEFEGYYSLNQEQFEFREVVNYTPQKEAKFSWEVIYDLEQRPYFTVRQPKITRKDISKILVLKHGILISNKDVKKEGLNVGDLDLGDIYNIYFHIKKESIKRVERFFKNLRNKHVGIIKRDKLVFKSYFRGGYTIGEPIFTSGYDKKRIMFFIKGMKQNNLD